MLPSTFVGHAPTGAGGACDRDAVLQRAPPTTDEIRSRLRELFRDARQTFPWLHHRSLVRKVWPLVPDCSLKLLIEVAAEFPLDAERRTG
jgi:hypothetical protein